MPRLTPGYLVLLPLVLAGPAAAYDPIVVEQGWHQVAFDRDGDCAAEIRTNRKFALINAAGLGAGEQGRYYLTNADMEPIDWSIVANERGEWRKYYVPYLPDVEAGIVEITLSTRQCTLNLAFQWDTYVPDNDWSSIRAMGR